MDKSILTTTKQLLGIQEEYDHFNTDIISHINSAFMVLNQAAGIGPIKGFMIEGAEEKWSDFLDKRLDLNSVQQYVYLYTRRAFDPPQMGYLVESIQKQLDEHVWRLQVQVESINKEE